jgi:molybdopterin-binding protein
MKISARNTFKGKIKTLKEGSVMTEVTVEVSGGLDVVSVITNSSAASLGLSEGKEVHAVIKSSDVLIMTD